MVTLLHNLSAAATWLQRRWSGTYVTGQLGGCTDSVRKRFSPGPGPRAPAGCQLPSLGLISVPARGGTWGFLFTVQLPAARSPAVLTLGVGVVPWAAGAVGQEERGTET